VPAGVFDRALPGELRGAGDCVREAVAVSSEGGAVEEGEVEAGEAVHGLPQEGGARLNGRSGPEQLAKRTKLLILLYVPAMVNSSVESKARLRNLCNGEK
jgi:hypothetical protein